MRGAILRSRVRLDLDDQADPAAPFAFSNKPCPDQAAGGVNDRASQEAVQVTDWRQRYLVARSDGTIQPKRAKKRGMSDARNRSTTWEAL